jgi:quercetin dioxygenase-like cupin family protein
VVHFPPGASSELHHTDTVDYDVVLAGSIDLILDGGNHRLEAGDCTVITGIDHNWQAGPDGCTLSVTLLGSTPPPP